MTSRVRGLAEVVEAVDWSGGRENVRKELAEIRPKGKGEGRER